MIRRLALVAVLGIGLGLLMQILVIAIRAWGDHFIPGIEALADLLQSVTWSTLVCTSLAVAVSVGKGRRAIAGVLGMVFAPLALAIAKASQKAVLVLIDAVQQPTSASLVAIGVLRAFEYGLLAWLLARLTENQVIQMAPYLRRGISMGIFFGAIMAWLSYSAMASAGTASSISQWLALGVTEIVSPAGCALVIYLGQLASHGAQEYNMHHSSGGDPGVR